MAKHRAPQLEPSIIVIFGITGDLAQRYLLPALYHLMKDDLLHERTEIVGISRKQMSASQLLDDVELCINETDNVCDPEVLKRMQAHTRMIQMNLTDHSDYDRLLNSLNAIESGTGVCMNRLYYLAIPPQVYGPIIGLMGSAGLNTSCPHGVAMTRLLVEKPFGYDLTSAETLIADTAKVFGEEQVFRIDHYLAKETVQNILTFRFQNPIFEAIWNHENVASIEISASEKIGIEGRAHFYDTVGALRDFIQSHLLQLLAIVTMDQPSRLDSDHIHAKKQAVMEQVRSVPANAVAEQSFRAQYDGYKQEVGNADSTTETLAGIRVCIDNDRWRDVPITLWTGKGLAEKKTEISLTFRSETGVGNKLRFRIQPNEGIEIELVTKKPGFETELQTAVMDFSYQANFGSHEHPNAYERVLADAVRGDHTLFATGREVLEAWRIVQPVLDEWAKQTAPIASYNPGTAGGQLMKSLEA